MATANGRARRPEGPPTVEGEQKEVGSRRLEGRGVTGAEGRGASLERHNPLWGREKHRDFYSLRVQSAPRLPCRGVPVPLSTEIRASVRQALA